MSEPNVCAIVIGLNEEPFIDACIRAIYPFVRRIWFVTNYDTDYYGKPVTPDLTIARVLGILDPDRKISVLISRMLLDETIQRHWAIECDKGFFASTRLQFRPHAHALDYIRSQVPKTDYFWVVDSDEIYDPSSIPAAFDYLETIKPEAIAVRGYNYFKSWNYRISPFLDQFWQIGFLKPDKRFYSRRRFYVPRIFTILFRINSDLAANLLYRYWREKQLSTEIAYFHHGSYVGGENRIRNKLSKSSHLTELEEIDIDSWIADVWNQWTPDMRNFRFGAHKDIWSHVDYVPTEQLPPIISRSSWPEGWIERPSQAELQA